MTVLQSLLLGVVQGITEFLPVSSSGHLIILRNLMGISPEGSLMFEVLAHIGTLIAIIIVFRRDLMRMVGETAHMIRDLSYNFKVLTHNRKEKDAIRYKKILHNNYRKFVAMIVCATIPTGIIGYAAADLVELSAQSLMVPGICLILTALLLLIAAVSEPGKKVPKDASLTNAFMIGIAQGISALPGLSRSGVTIAACLISGFDSRFAVKYSFIMSIPAILGALILETGRAFSGTLTAITFFTYLPGAVAAGIVGYFCIRKMLLIVRKRKLKGFALYCFLIGALSIGGYFIMR